MQFEYLKSVQYQDETAKLADAAEQLQTVEDAEAEAAEIEAGGIDAVQQGVVVDLEAFRRDAEVREQRAEVLRGIERRAGVELNVVVDGGDKEAVAFVKQGERVANIREEALDDPKLAEHAAFHEKGHLDTQIFELKLGLWLKERHFQALSEAIGVDLHEVDLVEGFNELMTIREHGKHQDVAYLRRDVPAAEKLEELAQEYLTDVSLVETFGRGDQNLFLKQLWQLAQALMIEKVKVA